MQRGRGGRGGGAEVVNVSGNCTSARIIAWVYFVDYMGAYKACCTGDKDVEWGQHDRIMLGFRPALRATARFLSVLSRELLRSVVGKRNTEVCS